MLHPPLPSKMINKFILRFLQSRFPDKWLRQLPIGSRVALLSGFWKSLNKGLNFAERYDLMSALYNDRQFKNYSLLSSRNHARIFGLFSIINEVSDVEGEIVEAGVGMGISLATLGYAVSYYELNKKVYGFDSFKGFPDATKEDYSSRVRHNEIIGWDVTSDELILRIFERDHHKIPEGLSLLRNHNVDIKLFPGFFNETFASNLPSKIALLHVDCDLYESYKLVLEAGFPRMTTGGFILFDEYQEDNWPGATQAVDEFAEKHELPIEYYAPLNKYVIHIP